MFWFLIRKMTRVDQNKCLLSRDNNRKKKKVQFISVAYLAKALFELSCTYPDGGKDKDGNGVG